MHSRKFISVLIFRLSNKQIADSKSSNERRGRGKQVQMAGAWQHVKVGTRW
jgi:hypothetical protein